MASSNQGGRHKIVTDKQFYAAFRAAQQYSDPGPFASSIALSDIFPAVDGDDLPTLIEELRHVWRYAHITVREIVQHTGLTQADFAQRFVIPQRTVESWCTGDRACPPYTRLMLAKLCGL